MNNTERIDRYLRGELAAAERQAFEEALNNDAELAAELKLQKDMEQFLRRQDQRAALKNQLDQIGTAFFQSAATAPTGGRVVPLRRPALLRWSIGIAATLALLLLARFLLQPNLYEQYAQHPPLALVEKSASDQNERAALEAAFNQQDYARALPLLEGYLAKHPEDAQIQLYIGICLLETDQFAKAQQRFEPLSKAETSGLMDYGQWYLALTALKQGDKAACRAILQGIPTDSEFFGRARDLLKRLGK